MNVFPVPVIPAGTLKRSFLCSAASGMRYGFEWLRILQALAPRRARSLSPLQPLRVFHVLIAYLGTLFPVYDIDWGYLEEIDGDEMYYLWAEGIPLEVMGLDYENIDYCGSPALICAYNLMAYDGRGPDDVFPPDFDKYEDLVRPFIGRDFPERHSAPRGRWWIRPWDALPDLVAYCQGNTGYAVLDWSQTEVAEAGGGPRWHIDEIRALARDWPRARSLNDRIFRLTRYIDERPVERLPLLAGALSGDADTLHRITKPARPRRLVEAFR